MFAENQTDLDLFCHRNGLADTEAGALARYIEMLERWSQRTNLISQQDQRRLVRRHIADSFAFASPSIIPAGAAVLDLGSGAGFPGIPLALWRSDLQITLLDAKRMRTLFLREVVEQLHLRNAVIVCDRVEALAKQKCFFTVVTARAVASVGQLWEWSRPLLQPGGRLVTQKGRGEATGIDPALQIREVEIVDSESNSVILVVQEGGRGEEHGV